jgi:hypothetical protein
MSRIGYLGALAAVALSLLAAGCGKTIVDLNKTEDQIRAEAEKRSADAKVSSVECPADLEVEPGREFTCTVRISGGGTETATLRIRDEEANLTLLSLEADG